MSEKLKNPLRQKVSWHVRSAKEEYEKTGNLKYVIIAIGKFPKNPPQWALDECKRFYDCVQSAPEQHIKIIMKEANALFSTSIYSNKDIESLNKIAEILHGASPYGLNKDNKMTLTKAIKQVTGEESDSANNNRLERYWLREIPDVDDRYIDKTYTYYEAPPESEELRTYEHPRVQKIIEEKAKEFAKQVTNKATTSD